MGLLRGRRHHHDDLAGKLRPNGGQDPLIGMPPTPDPEPEEKIDAASHSSNNWTTGHLYGEKTTFGKAPWWTSKGWWKASGDHEAHDIRAHVGTVADLAVAACSLRGNRHRTTGDPNQDSFSIALATNEDGAPTHIVACVCDGMGSAEHSAFGARLASIAVATRLAESVHGDVNALFVDLSTHQKRFIDRITELVLDSCGSVPGSPPKGTRLQDLQTTLTFAIVEATEPLHARAALVGSIGDSPLFVLRSGELELIAAGKDAEDAVFSTATSGLLGATAMSLATVSLAPGDGLVLTSDGVGGFVVHNGQPTALGRDLGQQWRQPVGLLDFVIDLSFEMASADDDRTAVVIWSRNQETWPQ
jgi:hypothetical protein